MPRAQASGRKATNVSLDSALVEEARKLDLNLSRLFEERLREAIAAERRRLWLKENEEAFAGYAGFV